MKEDIIKNIKRLGFQWETPDPFLFCVHHEDFFPEGNGRLGPEESLLEGRMIGQDFAVKDGFRMYHGQKIPGFPMHPHRGFETVTLVLRGMVDHSDSLGGAGRYGNGDTQWMTAGRGIQHAEMFPLIHEERENTLELFQIWLNLPARSKMVDPHYKMLWQEDIPVYTSEDGKSKILMVAGQLGEIQAPAPPPNSWAAEPANELAIWVIDMEAGAELRLPPASAGISRTLYFFKGNTLGINGTGIDAYQSAELRSDQELNLESGGQAARLLLLQGKPIAEPVVQHGPFVMNTQAEIQQTFVDFQLTGFGHWNWESSEPNHGQQGRFARYTDGREETRD